LEGGGEFDLDGGQDGFVRGAVPAEGLVGDTGRDLERAGYLGEAHFLDLLIPQIVEVALDGGQELLGNEPFLFAKFAGATGLVGGLLLAGGEFDLSLLLEEAGVKRLDAFSPVVFAGPFPDRGRNLAEFVDDRLKGAGMAELEEGGEGAEGTRRFAGEGTKS